MSLETFWTPRLMTFFAPWLLEAAERWLWLCLPPPLDGGLACVSMEDEDEDGVNPLLALGSEERASPSDPNSLLPAIVRRRCGETKPKLFWGCWRPLLFPKDWLGRDEGGVEGDPVLRLPPTKDEVV